MKNNILEYIAYSLAIIMLVVCVSCSEEKNISKERNNYDNPTISISIISNGIADSEEEDFSRASQDIPIVTIPVNDSIDITATLSLDYRHTNNSRAVLGDGIVYRVIAYKKNDITPTGYVNHADYVMGGNMPEFNLPANCDYTIICYSFGLTGSMETFSKETTGINILPVNGDVLYCKKNIYVDENYHEFAIEFTHIFSQVTVVIDNSVNSCPITNMAPAILSPTYDRARLSLADGTLTKSAIANTTLFSWIALNGEIVTSNSQMVITHGEEVTLSLPSITIDTYPATIITDKKFTFTGRQILPNRKYKLNIGFINKNYMNVMFETENTSKGTVDRDKIMAPSGSTFEVLATPASGYVFAGWFKKGTITKIFEEGLQTDVYTTLDNKIKGTLSGNTNSITYVARFTTEYAGNEVCGSDVLWSPGFLKRNTTTGVYEFYTDQSSYSGQAAGGDYWCWNELDPTVYGVVRGSWDEKRDPCRQVAPMGTWKTPTYAQYVSLASTTNSSGAWFGCASAYDLLLPYAGGRFPNGGMGYVGSHGNCWTQTAINAANAYCPNYWNGAISYNVYSIGMGYGHTIRCVKAKP